MAVEMEEKPCTIVLHDDRITKKDVLAGQRAMHVGEFAYLNASRARTLCIAPAGLASNSTEISIHVNLASKFGFENRTQGRVQIIEDPDPATATHVELFFRDQYLSRADMWQLMGRVQHSVLYQGQILRYLGSGTAEVRRIYIAGQEVESAISSHPHTKPIFRSGSARYTILIEISREMLENWSNGDLMYERMINGFLPALFRRWESLKVKHQISIVLFGRVVNVHENGVVTHGASHGTSNEDFFHVLVSEAPSASWRHIMKRLKQTFNDHRLPHSVSLAADSNILEAIHLTAMDFADDQTDAHLMSTGTSIIAISAGSGLFEADHTLLKQTTDLLVGNSIGVDIVALSPKPLHPVPLFRYDHNGTIEFALPHWVDISFWNDAHDHAQSTWTLTNIEEPVDDISLPLLRESGWSEVDTSIMDYHDNKVFQDRGPAAQAVVELEKSTTTPDVAGSVDTVKGVPIPGASPKKNIPPIPADVGVSPTESTSNASNKEPLSRAKRQRLPPHPLMQSGRKISVGPKGLAPSRGVASTTVSNMHAQHERETGLGASHATSDSSNGLAKAIRASLARKPSQQSLVSHRTSGSDQYQISRPIDIGSVSEENDNESSDPASDLKQGIADTMVGTVLEYEKSLSATPKAKNMFPRKGSMNDSLDMLSPWVMLLNPCNPRRDNMRVASQYRKWQHVFPRAISSGAFKWSSMCSPAALPLTAEYKPSASELGTHYKKKVRRHVISNSSGLRNETARVLVERLIDVRLISGFQIVAIRNTGGDHTFQSKDKPVLLSWGRRYHELQRFSDFEIQVVQYDPKAGVGSEESETQHYLTSYEPKMRMMTGVTVKPEVTYHSESPLADWSSLDEYILGLSPAPDVNVSLKVRLILIPVDITKSDRHAQTRLEGGGLSDEERRIEGIQKLTQTWQRQRHFSAEDQQRHVSLTKSKPAGAIERDSNPLAIEYETRDPSVVVKARGHALSNQLEGGELTTPLFTESEKHHSSNFDLEKLVKQMQESSPFGVEMRDRRWLTQTHLKCFRGDEMTTWLLGAFKDLDLREDAVALGNELMDRGIFTHVRQKHKFRDGNYFYQIASAHRTTEYPDTQGLFSKAPWRSVPATPISETVRSPVMRPITNDSSSSSGRPTPVLEPVNQKAKELLLSQVMRYNVDPQKKSDHLQVIDLHYDRIHNPENCYHIQLEWLGASTKLVREAISRWSSTVEGYGLKLVQVPLDEASKFREHHPFDQPQSIRLIVRPPDSSNNLLSTPLMQPHAISPRPNGDHFTYHKALLRMHDFVLDIEAAREFNTDIHVTYSWGPPSFNHTQFVHKSGLVIAQILGNEVGDFLLLPNRLAPTSKTSSTSPKLTDMETIDGVMKTFKECCRNEEALRQIYSQVEKPKSAAPSPFASATLAADFDVPPMQLPEHLNHKTQGHRHWLGLIE